MSLEYRLSHPVQASVFDHRFVARGFSIQIDEQTTHRTKGQIYFTEKSALIIPESDGTVLYLETKLWLYPQPFLLAIIDLLKLTVYSEDDPQFWGFANEAEMFATMGGGSINPGTRISEISASMGDGNRLPRSGSNEKTLL